MSQQALTQAEERSPTTRVSMLRQVLSVPNQLTMLRMIVLPFVLISMIYEQHEMALWLFVAAAVTDGIDGLVARHFNQKTLLGEFLDPIADKLLLSSCFIVQALIGAIPWWITVLVLVRDITIIATVLVMFLATSLKRFPPSVFGKVNTAAQILTLFAVLSRNAWGGAPAATLVDVLIWVTAATTLLSSVHYALETSRRVHGYHSGSPSV